MYIERDTKFNLIYIGFSDLIEKGTVARTIEIMPGVSFDLDTNDKLLGIEIFSTEEVIGVPASDLDLSGELIGAEEAAELFGKDQTEFLEYIASRSDFPQPIVSLKSGDLWFSKDIESYKYFNQLEIYQLGLKGDEADREILEIVGEHATN